MSDIRPLTEKLWTAAVLDIWPDGNAAIVDFGLASERHYGALQHAIKHGHTTKEQLDAAMGSGPKLTALCQQPCNPYRDAVFKSAW